jgi:hypothetical protein
MAVSGSFAAWQHCDCDCDCDCDYSTTLKLVRIRNMCNLIQVNSYVEDLRFSQRQLWILSSSGIQRLVVHLWTEVSEEYITSTFR